MKNNTNAFAASQCKSSDFMFCHASETTICPKAQGKLTAIYNMPSLSNGIVQLNQKEATLTFYNENINSLFIKEIGQLKESANKSKQLIQPLKYFNTIVSNTVGFTIFCLLLIATGILVWAYFS
ncbi:hypothetical protein [Lutibacter sp.]